MRFATTRWSLVLYAADRGSPKSQASLAALCETYWYPVYAFVRRGGYDADDARDLTQAFFARVLEHDFLQRARPNRGRFRSLLLTSVRHFVANEYERQRALKRGGGHVHLSLECDDGERRYQLEPADPVTPEDVYERRWALDTIDKAMHRLAARHVDSARRALFERLRPFLTGEEVPDPKELAGELGLSEGALRVAVHRLRRQFASVLRDTVAETVERDEDVDDELRHLLHVVSR